jgi:PTH1 family peptidyl-tRNA hydrolase
VIEHFGTESVPRLRIGIGSAPIQGATDYVLGRFFEEEQPILEATILRAATAVKCAIDKGLIAAMNQFNQQAEEK